jgi:hypothetical protein
VSLFDADAIPMPFGITGKVAGHWGAPQPPSRVSGHNRVAVKMLETLGTVAHQPALRIASLTGKNLPVTCDRF